MVFPTHVMFKHAAGASTAACRDCFQTSHSTIKYPIIPRKRTLVTMYNLVLVQIKLLYAYELVMASASQKRTFANAASDSELNRQPYNAGEKKETETNQVAVVLGLV